MGLIVNTNTTRQRNQKLVLDYVRRHGPISSASMAKELHVPAGTIARVVGSLIELGLLRQVKERKSNGVGKPPVFLEVNSDYALICGVELNELTTRIVVSDFTGKVLTENAVSTIKVLEDIFKNISALISDAIGKLDRKAGTLKWVGVGLSGVLSPDDGRIVQGFLPVGLPFGESLEKSINVPVTVGNDANCAVLAEKAFGAAVDCENVVCLLDRGWIGAGLYLNGGLYSGARNAAGELLAGLPSSIIASNKTKVSEFPFIESYGLERELKESHWSIADTVDFESRETLLKELAEMALKGNVKAKRILESEASRFATAIARLSGLFDPDLVMVSGDVAAGGSLVEKLILDKIKEFQVRSNIGTFLNEVSFKFSALNQRGVALGAISQALEALCDAVLSE